MAEYTADGDKLHMAYSFNLLVPNCSSALHPQAGRRIRGARQGRLGFLVGR
jgi:hypothetical protein